MATAFHQVIAAQYQNYSIYMTLESRGAQPGFHWGIFIPTATPSGYVWHVTDREGSWKLEQIVSATVPFSISLVLAYKVGSISSSTWQMCYSTLQAVPVINQPSPNEPEVFSCRVWAKNAIQALYDNGVIILAEAVPSIENKLVNWANAHKPGVEAGQSSARVEN